MRSDELVTAVRVAGRFSDSDTDYTDARIRQELTDTLHTVFGGKIIAARAGHWIKRVDTTITAGRIRYRLPARASAIESIELVDAGDALYDIEGDVIVFDEDNPPAADTVIRVRYYVRPSLLVEEQASTDAGEVTAKDADALTVTVDSVPTDRVAATAVVSGDTLDIVHPNGWHELSLCNVAATLSSLTFTFPSGTDLTDVEVGDFVRAADQTDWPAIQDEYHRALVDITAASMLRSRSDHSKADKLMEKAAGDITRFSDLIEPRVKNDRQVVMSRTGVIRGGFGRRWPTVVP